MCKYHSKCSEKRLLVIVTFKVAPTHRGQYRDAPEEALEVLRGLCLLLHHKLADPRGLITLGSDDIPEASHNVSDLHNSQQGRNDSHCVLGIVRYVDVFDQSIQNHSKFLKAEIKVDYLQDDWVWVGEVYANHQNQK